MLVVMQTVEISILIFTAFATTTISGLKCRSGLGIDMKNVISENIYGEEVCSEVVGTQKCFIGSVTFNLLETDTTLSYGGCIGEQIASYVTCDAIFSEENPINVDQVFPALKQSFDGFINKTASESAANFQLLLDGNTGPFAINLTKSLNNAFVQTGWQVDPMLEPFMDEVTKLLLSMVNPNYEGIPPETYTSFINSLKNLDTENTEFASDIETFLTNNFDITLNAQQKPLVTHLPVAIGVFFYKNKEQFVTVHKPTFTLLKKLDFVGGFSTNDGIAFSEFVTFHIAEALKKNPMDFCPDSVNGEQNTVVQQMCESPLFKIDYTTMFAELSIRLGNGNVNSPETIVAIIEYPVSIFYSSNPEQVKTAMTKFFSDLIMNKPINEIVSSTQALYSAIVSPNGQAYVVEMQRILSMAPDQLFFMQGGMVAISMFQESVLTNALNDGYAKLTAILEKIDTTTWNFSDAVNEVDTQFPGILPMVEAALKISPGDLNPAIAGIANTLAQTNFSDPNQVVSLPSNVIQNVGDILSAEAKTALLNLFNSMFTGGDVDTIYGHLNDFYATYLPSPAKGLLDDIRELMLSANISSVNTIMMSAYQGLAQMYIQNDTAVVMLLDEHIPKIKSIVNTIGSLLDPQYDDVISEINNQYAEIKNSEIAQKILTSMPAIIQSAMQTPFNENQFLVALKVLTDKFDTKNQYANAAAKAQIDYQALLGSPIPKNMEFVVYFSYQVQYYFFTKPEEVAVLNLSNQISKIHTELQSGMAKAFVDPYSVELGKILEDYFTEYETILNLDKGTVSSVYEPITNVATELSRVNFTHDYHKMFPLLKQIVKGYAAKYPDSLYPAAVDKAIDFTKSTMNLISNYKEIIPDEYIKEAIAVNDAFMAAFGITEEQISSMISAVFPQLTPFYSIYKDMTKEEKDDLIIRLVNIYIESQTQPEKLIPNIENLIKEIMGSIDLKNEIANFLNAGSCKFSTCSEDNCNTLEFLEESDTYTLPPDVVVTTEALGITDKPKTTTRASGCHPSYSYITFMGSLVMLKMFT